MAVKKSAIGANGGQGSASNETQSLRESREIYTCNPSVPTFGGESPYGDRSDVLRRLAELVRENPQVQRDVSDRVKKWLETLIGKVPHPFVAIGEDGSISTEWDIGELSLHITFEKDTEEVYFFSPNGEEWESTLDETGKVGSAMLAVEAAAAAAAAAARG